MASESDSDKNKDTVKAAATPESQATVGAKTDAVDSKERADNAVKITKKTNKRPMIVFGVLIAAVFVLLGIGGTLTIQDLWKSNAVTEHGTVKNDGNKLTSQSEMTISAVAKQVSPSVVSIVTKIESPSNFWFSEDQEAAGSGIIVGSDGIILTNKHVINGASKVQVMLADGTVYNDVSVLGSDPLNDIAYLKISNVKDLPAVELGDSSTVKIGQSVIAIGNSLGEYQNTVTSGIISALGRPLTAQDSDGSSTENLSDLIQTDAAINPGNSGGPLLNMSGQVIGINTAIAQDAQGIGFSIPINSVKGTLKEVLAGKPVERSYLGVRYVPVSKALAEQYKLSVDSGAYISSGSDGSPAVVSGSPADKAGIKAGDVITAVNGVKVTSQLGVSSLVAEYAPNDTIQITYVRGNATKTVDVKLGTYK